MFETQPRWLYGVGFEERALSAAALATGGTATLLDTQLPIVVDVLSVAINSISASAELSIWPRLRKGSLPTAPIGSIATDGSTGGLPTLARLKAQPWGRFKELAIDVGQINLELLEPWPFPAGVKIEVFNNTGASINVAMQVIYRVML